MIHADLSTQIQIVISERYSQSANVSNFGPKKKKGERQRESLPSM